MIRHRFLYFTFILFITFLSSACISQSPAPQYVSRLNFASAYVLDDDQGLLSQALPENTATALNTSFSARGLAQSLIPQAELSANFDKLRDSQRRLQLMQSIAPKADVLTLVEAKASFYSQLSGRYRWDVKVKLSLSDPKSGVQLSDEFSIPSVLMYAHEKSDAAIDAVKDEIARRLGSLLDNFMRGKEAGSEANSPSVLPPNPVEPKPGAAPLEAPKENAPAESSPEGGAPLAQAIYFIMVDRFFNAQGDAKFSVNPKDPLAWHGGDLAGVAQKLDYLQSLGITQIWLSPLFSTAQENFFGNAAFHAYWTYDLGQIEPRFGSRADLENLAKEAKKRGIGIILDFVVNHVGYGSPLVESKKDWFHAAASIEDWNDPKALVEGQVHGLPDLNQDNPEVYQYLLRSAQTWLQIPNIAGYRLDAVKHVPLSFWKRFNESLLSQNKDLILLGEMFDGSPKIVTDTQKEGAFSHMFDFPLAFALRDVFCEQKSLANLASVIDNDRIYNNAADMVTFLDNHDLPRIASLCKEERDLKNALTTLLALRGVPSLYYGTESKLVGDKEPENRSNMNFDSTPLFDHIRGALQIRSQHPVWAKGKTSVLEYREGFLALVRQDNKNQALVLINQQDGALEFKLPSGNWTDPQNQETKSGILSLGPKTVVLLVKTAGSSLIADKSVRVTFHLKANSKAEYALVGSGQAFGFWDPSKAPKIKANEEKTFELPAQTVTSYKLVRFDQTKAKWENGANRELFTGSADGSVTLEADRF